MTAVGVQVFELFDVKNNQVIEFGEFIRSLSIFHPDSPVADKIACKLNHLFLFLFLSFTLFGLNMEVSRWFPQCFVLVFVFLAVAFRLYDLRGTGYIEREDLKLLVLALLDESDLSLSDDVVESIVETTFKEADGKGDGKIDKEEWKDFVAKNPNLIKNVTLPYLKDISAAFPSFVLRPEADDGGEIIHS